MIYEIASCRERNTICQEKSGFLNTHIDWQGAYWLARQNTLPVFEDTKANTTVNVKVHTSCQSKRDQLTVKAKWPTNCQSKRNQPTVKAKEPTNFHCKKGTYQLSRQKGPINCQGKSEPTICQGKRDLPTVQAKSPTNCQGKRDLLTVNAKSTY